MSRKTRSSTTININQPCQNSRHKKMNKFVQPDAASYKIVDFKANQTQRCATRMQPRQTFSDLKKENRKKAPREIVNRTYNIFSRKKHKYKTQKRMFLKCILLVNLFMLLVRIFLNGLTTYISL